MKTRFIDLSGDPEIQKLAKQIDKRIRREKILKRVAVVTAVAVPVILVAHQAKNVINNANKK